MTALDRSAPGVRVTLLSHERAKSGVPLGLDGRILAFTFEESEKKAAKATLQLDNFDLSFFERDELIGGAVLGVSWGYPGLMSPLQRVVVRKLKGFQTLTVEGDATSMLMHRLVKARSWKNKTRSEVARLVATEAGFQGATLDVEETCAVLDTVSQYGESDAAFLRRLAAKEGFAFFVDDAGLHWRSRSKAKPPGHVLTWYSDPGRGDIISVSVESDLLRRAGRVQVRGRDPIAKTSVEADASSSNTERETLGELVEVVDPRDGTTSLAQRNATVSAQTSAATTAESAKQQAGAGFRKAERETVKLALQVVGDPTLRANTLVEVRGISSLLSGKYFVSEAKHLISSSGYVTELKLTRDGTGRRQRATGLTGGNGQAQGGQPNRSDGSPGGELTAVEVIDRKDGTRRVEYRRDGQTIGAEDPEGQVSRRLP